MSDLWPEKFDTESPMHNHTDDSGLEKIFNDITQESMSLEKVRAAIDNLDNRFKAEMGMLKTDLRSVETEETEAVGRCETEANKKIQRMTSENKTSVAAAKRDLNTVEERAKDIELRIAVLEGKGAQAYYKRIGEVGSMLIEAENNGDEMRVSELKTAMEKLARELETLSTPTEIDPTTKESDLEDLQIAQKSANIDILQKANRVIELERGEEQLDEDKRAIMSEMETTIQNIREQYKDKKTAIENEMIAAKDKMVRERLRLEHIENTLSKTEQTL